MADGKAELERAREQAEKVLRKLERLYTDDCRLTLIVRNVSDLDAWLVLSKDDLGAVADVLDDALREQVEEAAALQVLERTERNDV